VSDKKDGDGGKGAQPDQKPERQDKPSARWPWVLAALCVLGFVGVVLWISLVPASAVWTDDAYVQVHYASVAPRIAGQVVSVSVDDNDTVAASAELVRLDDRDQRASLAQAKAMLARDQAQFRDALANVARQPSVIGQQSAQVQSLDAQIGLAQANRTRYRNLASTGAGTEQSRQSADATLAQEEAELQGAKASTDAARHQLDVLNAMADADRATIAADEAQVRQAELTLSYTRILAPLHATVTERSVQVGDYVSPGGVLMSLVPLDRVYVVANYLETALKHVLPGQHVRIHVDAYNIVLDGVVQGVPPASGAIYSPVPPNNATGNFTKIVQRLPVKILVTPGQPLAKLLRAGFSVETTIDTHLADVVGAQANSATPVTSD
jgi:membrane fusion protein (multidrug efflux system)